MPGKQPPLPVFGQIPGFELIDETGRPFDGKSLEGKVWVADFIFTTCSGPCPRMSSLMRQVQQASSAMPDVKLVSFTVDPERDTPAALAQYAARYHAQPERWHFLTGPREALDRLTRDAFKLGNVDGQLVHSTRLVLLIGQGQNSRLLQHVGRQPGGPTGARHQARPSGDIMIGIRDLPAINATLNATAAVLLVWGYILIRRQSIAAHRKVMLAAFATSTRFPLLLPDLPLQRRLGPFPRNRRDPDRLPVHPGDAHRASGRSPAAGDHHAEPRPASEVRPPQEIARWTLPVWLYVSVTGVVVYWMLYRMA